VLPAAVLLQAAEAEQDAARAVLADFVESLGDSEPGLALRNVARDSPARDALRDRLPVLLQAFLVDADVREQQAEVTPDGAMITSDWTLKLRRRGGATTITERRESVKVELRPEKKKWRIWRIEPAEMFNP